jgi:hypothetical protein
MSLIVAATIEIPSSRGSAFDHGAFESETRRVFIAHTARNCLEVVDVDTSLHVATLSGFPEAAGVVAGEGCVLSRTAAAPAWPGLMRTRWKSGPFLIPHLDRTASRSCRRYTLQSPPASETTPTNLSSRYSAWRQDRRWSIDLPGRPRWCVIDAKARRVFLAIRDPSMVLVANLPELNAVQHWPLACGGAHGMDIDHASGLLYVACDGGPLVEVDTRSGEMRRQWPLHRRNAQSEGARGDAAIQATELLVPVTT